MVHISEVANIFVNEIKDHLTEVRPSRKVLNLGDDGKDFAFHQEGSACATEKAKRERSPRWQRGQT